jgi:hypothetical protein
MSNIAYRGSRRTLFPDDYIDYEPWYIYEPWHTRDRKPKADADKYTSELTAEFELAGREAQRLAQQAEAQRARQEELRKILKARGWTKK